MTHWHAKDLDIYLFFMLLLCLLTLCLSALFLLIFFLLLIADGGPGSMLFGRGIAEHCIRRDKILQFLMSAANEPEGGGVDLALISEVMGLQALRIDSHQPPTPLIYPGTDLYAEKPLLDFVGDLVGSSRITIHPDGRVLFNGTGTEVTDLLSVVAEFYLHKNSAKWKKQSMLVPNYNRYALTFFILAKINFICSVNMYRCILHTIRFMKLSSHYHFYYDLS